MPDVWSGVRLVGPERQAVSRGLARAYTPISCARTPDVADAAVPKCGVPFEQLRGLWVWHPRREALDRLLTLSKMAVLLERREQDSEAWERRLVVREVAYLGAASAGAAGDDPDEHDESEDPRQGRLSERQSPEPVGEIVVPDAYGVRHRCGIAGSMLTILRKIGIRSRVVRRPAAARNPGLDPRVRVALANDVVAERALLPDAVAHHHSRGNPGRAREERHPRREVFAVPALADE